MGAFDVTVVSPGGEVVAEYAREWARRRRTRPTPVLQLRLLAVRPGGWRDSVVRRSLPDELVAFLDSEAPRTWGPTSGRWDVSALSGWAAAVEGALRSL